MNTAPTPSGPQGIVDVDTHLADADEELWRPYFAQGESEWAPRLEPHGTVTRLNVGGLVLPNPAGPGVGSPLGSGAASPVSSLDERRAFMRETGIARGFLLPGFVGLAALNHPDPTVRRVLARAHNALLHDLATEAPELEFVPVVLPDDPEWSLAELARWGTHRTLRAVVSRPTTLDPRPYRDGLKAPLLAHLAAEGIVLMLHGATGYHQASPLADQFDDYRYTHVFTHPFEQMTALTDLVASEALAGGLKVALVEAGCGWLPWFVGRLQEHFDHTGGLPRIDTDVTALLRSQVLVSVEPEDQGIEAFHAHFGEGMLAFGSDYPHWDAARPDDLLSLPQRLGEPAADGILRANARAFFGLAKA
ncbi:amidohydrolase family protein [Streptomyces sp. NPDC014685]|uniref:amidohydrolase family protein n=1 Tax=Streptomyces sp. NPDC014685 TaxID=3364881 RepID=UPI0036F8DB09